MRRFYKIKNIKLIIFFFNFDLNLLNKLSKIKFNFYILIY